MQQAKGYRVVMKVT